MTTSREWTLIPKEQIEIIKKHQENLPIQVGRIAKELGLIVKLATLSAGVSGEIKESNGKYIIRVNRHDVKARQRFTVAHEIAHFLLHRDKIGDGIVDDILYRSTLSDALEAQANRLAADIIMPWELIRNSLNNYSHLKPESRIEKLADEVEVSTTAIKIRLGKL